MINAECLFVVVTEGGNVFADMDRDEALGRYRDCDDTDPIAREFEIVVNVPDRNPLQAKIDLPEGEGGKAEVTIS